VYGGAIETPTGATAVTDTFKTGDNVRVYTWTAPRKLIGIGRIGEIVPWLKGYDGPVACINVRSHSGRFLRSFGELELVS
jgi:hypothetical protein